MSFKNLSRDNITLGEKFFSISWPFVILLCLVAFIGYLSLYSAAGGSNDPWAGPHALRFAVGLVGLMITAMIDIRLWMRFAY
ncbi:MAG TPA: rod shape-determining protein RodA, partial [Alphaproteobacteria bacterium]|nr:rod shape-determining protein RodA [Alphaproteobacteria bacterium]